MHGISIGGLAGVLLLLGSACAAPTDRPATRPTNAVEVNASAETRAATAVTVWSVSRSADGSVTGYDAANEAVVELSHTTKVEGGRTLDAYVLEQNGASSWVVLSFQPSASTVVVASEVSDAHRRIADLLTSDLRSGPNADEAALMTTALDVRTPKLAPLGGGNDTPLTSPCVKLVNDCNTALVTYKAAHAQLVFSCLSDSAATAKCHPSGGFAPLFPQGLDCTTCESCLKKECDEATADQNESAQAAQRCSTDPEYYRCGGAYDLQEGGQSR